MPRLSDRLMRATQRSFVGRDDELRLFQRALTEPSAPFAVLYLHGVGGAGKTTLLRRFCQICSDRNTPCIQIDARRMNPSPEDFLKAWEAAKTGGDEERRALLIDTYECISALDGWLREVFLPDLPDGTVVVIAGRTPPALEWRTHPGWHELCVARRLGNLTTEECLEYLRSSNLPEANHAAALRFTHGHPLSLALAVDVLSQRPDIDLDDHRPPDILHSLLERFTDEAPTPRHREALEIASLVRMTTEELLTQTLGDAEEAHSLFTWLRGLSFIEITDEGLIVHDAVREALVAELQWRNRERYLALHQLTRDYYFERYHRSLENQTPQILFDYIYLHRHIDSVRPFFDWFAEGELFADSYRESDRPAILEMTSRHEGAESADIADRWLASHSDSVTVFRGGTTLEDRPAGWMMTLDLSKIDPAQASFDPAVVHAKNQLGNGNLVDEKRRTTFFRFWMGAESYQDVSPVQNQVFILAVRHYLSTPGLAFSIFPFAKADFWKVVMQYGDLHRMESLDFEIGGRHHGAFVHDWRETPPTAWISLVTERQQWLDAQLHDLPSEAEPLPIPAELPPCMERDKFDQAVRHALRDFTQPDRLLKSPLIHARMTVEALDASTGDAQKRVKALQKLILSTLAPLQDSPRDSRLYVALDLAFFHPASSQERAAEKQDVSYATYRRYLSAGISRLCDGLWSRECGDWSAQPSK